MGSMGVWLILLAILFYAAILYTSKAMVLLAFSSAVLFVCMVGYLFVVRISLSEKISIPISVIDAGKKVTVQVFFRNKAVLPVLRAELFLEVRDSFEKKKLVQRIRISGIWSGENRTEFLLGFQRAGNYEIQIKKLRLYAPAGFFYLGKRVAFKKNVQVLPKISGVPVCLTQPVRNFFGDSDIYDEERPGEDRSEIFAIRPYREGDKLQSIHWKLSAKTGEWMVKEHSLPKACPVVLFLDYHVGKQKRKETFGAFLELGASLSFSLMDAGCAHYVAWYEEQIRDVVRLRVGTEEDFYLFLSCYLKEQGKKSPENMKILYDEKYQSERYLHSLRITEKLKLYKDEEMLCRMEGRGMESLLGGVEIVL